MDSLLLQQQSDSGGRPACSHRTDQEGLQSKGSFHKRRQLVWLLMVTCRPKSSTQINTPWQLRRRRSVSSIDLLLDQQLQEKMESKMKEIAAAHSCLSDPDKWVNWSTFQNQILQHRREEYPRLLQHQKPQLLPLQEGRVWPQAGADVEERGSRHWCELSYLSAPPFFTEALLKGWWH